MLTVNIFYHKHKFYIEQTKEIKIINLYFPVFPSLVENSSIYRDGKYRYLPPVIPSTGISRPTPIYSKQTLICNNIILWFTDTNWFATTNFPSKPNKDLCCYNSHTTRAGLGQEIFATTMLSRTSQKILTCE